MQTSDELAHTLNREGRYDEAEELARLTMETQRRVVGPDHPDTAGTTYDLACILAHNGRSDEAFSLLRHAIDHGLDAGTDRAMATDTDTDTDLKPLDKDARFPAFVPYAPQWAAAQ